MVFCLFPKLVTTYSLTPLAPVVQTLFTGVDIIFTYNRITMIERRRRTIATLVSICVFVIGMVVINLQDQTPSEPPPQKQIAQTSTGNAAEALKKLAIKGRAPKTGYSRDQFGAGWARVDECDMRDYILQRDLTHVVFDSSTTCKVLSGVLQDPYTGNTIQFKRGKQTSSAVQIDHVVALSDAWQKGAQNIDVAERAELANDPLNLLAVDGPTNNKKSDGDAATWLPPNKSYRCQYVARQIAVKQKYTLWVTDAEYVTMNRVLESCPGQQLPIVQ